MCLEKIYKYVNKKITTGYKVFLQSEAGELFFLYYNVNGEPTYFNLTYKNKAEINKWLYSEPKRIISTDKHLNEFAYTSGFHFFKKPEEAKLYTHHLFISHKSVIRKIEVKDIITRGLIHGLCRGVIPCMVCSQMKILEE